MALKKGRYLKQLQQIKAWLKAGYLDGRELFPTEEGTPQGGVISPLLANIALHGMETVLTEWVKTWKGGKRDNLKSFSFIRYADDFVILHESREVIEKAREILEIFLQPIGLQHSTVVSKETFSKLNDLTYRLLRRWCKRRHPNKSKGWIKDKYYQSLPSQLGSRNWVFSEGNQTLKLHSDTPIIRHIKVKGDKSPFDGDSVYWATRLGRSVELSKTEATLLKKQKGKCNYCGAAFREGDLWETDHITPKLLGGSNSYNNLQLLHAHCHDQKTRNDGSLKKGTHDKSQVGEERGEVKVSRHVLKTSGSREGIA